MLLKLRIFYNFFFFFLFFISHFNNKAKLMSDLNLQKPDALMNPEVLNHIDEYIQKGGDINSMISFLSSGYKGNFHIIDAFGFILQSLGVEFRDSFEKFLKEQIIQIFDPKITDQKFDIKNPPSWIESLASNNFWISVISDLLKKYPTSSFLLYSYDIICQRSPQFVKMIPPCRVSYDSYCAVVSSHLPLIRGQYLNTSHNQKLLKTFLSMITADDLTISHTAFLLDRNQDISLINAIIDFLENRKSSQKTFLTLLMRLEGCDDNIIETLQGDKQLDFEIIMQLSMIGTNSSFLRDYVLRRMTKEIFNPKFDKDYRSLLIKSILILTNTTVDEELFLDGIQCFLNWSFNSSNEIALALFCAKVKFCASAMIPIISKRILSSNPKFFADNPQPPTVERLLLCEISYWHRDLIPRVYRIVEKGIESSSSRHDLDNNEIHSMLSELYEIIVYLFELGAYKNVLNLFTKKLADSDSDLKRKALIKILSKAFPPYSKEFLSHMLKCLTDPIVKPLFFPSRGIPALPVQISGLEVVFRFTDRVNKDEASSSDPKEVPLYDNLRTSARQTIEIARGHKQHTLTSFFR